MAKLILNGKATDFPDGETLFGFLQSKKPGVRNLILELNGQILTENDPLKTIRLKEDDVLNLFSMVGGG